MIKSSFSYVLLSSFFLGFISQRWEEWTSFPTHDIYRNDKNKQIRDKVVVIILIINVMCVYIREISMFVYLCGYVHI